MLKAYSLALARDREAGARPETHRSLSPAEFQGWEDDAGGRLLEFEVNESSWYRQRRVRELSVPPGCVLVAVRRGHRTLAVSGATVMRAGDHVTAFLSQDGVQNFERWLQAPPRPRDEMDGQSPAS